MFDAARAERSGFRPYDNSKQTITRPIRQLMHGHVESIVDDERISGGAVRLLLWMLKQKDTYRFVVKNLARSGLFGGRDKVHALMRELRTAGYVKIDRDGRPQGGVEPGIYKVASEPTWIAEPMPVDNGGSQKSHDADQEAEGNPETKGPWFPAAHIRSSRSNQDTDTGCGSNETPACQPHQADGRDGGRKSHLTRKAERRPSGAKAGLPEDAERRTGGAKAGLPRKEPGSRPAKGSPVKGVSCGAGDETDNDRYIKHLRSRLIGVAGYCLASPKSTPGLWKMAEIVIWISMGYDLEHDILPVVANLSSRAGKDPGHIKSWRFFSDAIRDRRAQRIAAVKPARPDNGSDQVDWWHRLTLYINDKRHIWPTAKWGPHPGEENCLIPQQIIREFASKHAHYLERNAVPGLNS